MAWRILHRDPALPESVAAAALDVERQVNSKPAWTLLRSGNTRRTSRYEDAESGTAWVVKWGRGHAFSDWARGLFRANDAEKELALTRAAFDAGLPAIPYALAACTPRWLPPLRTLLVAPFAKGARDLTTALQFAWDDEAETNRLLDAAAALAARVHKAGFVHQDFSGSNLLVQPNGELLLIDWLKATRPVVAAPSGEHRADLVRAGADLLYAGVPASKIDRLVDAYLNAFDADSATAIDDATRAEWRRATREKAIAKRRKIAERAYENAFKGSREVESVKLSGGRALAFKGADMAIVEEWIRKLRDARIDFAPTCSPKSEAEAWRAACALERAGMRGHRAIALARSRMTATLNRPERGIPLKDAFLDPTTRHRAIAAIGGHAARGKTLGFAIRSPFDPAKWRLVEAVGGRPELEADSPLQWKFPLPAIDRPQDEIPYWEWLCDWLPTEEGKAFRWNREDAGAFDRAADMAPPPRLPRRGAQENEQPNAPPPRAPTAPTDQARS
jgi:hypothetical protein